MSKREALDSLELSLFTGTLRWFRHGLIRNVLFTEGAKYVADQAGAYWLLDEIAFAQAYDPNVSSEAFQVWDLKVTGNEAELTCEDGNGNRIAAKLIPFTDFPEPGIRIYCCDRTIMLPSEY